MRKQNKNRKLIIFLSIAFFAMSFVVVSIFYSHPTVAAEVADGGICANAEDSGCDIKKDVTLQKGLYVFNKSIHVYGGATLTIEPGAKIEFMKDSSGDNTSISILGGRILAEGTHDDPIYISSKETKHRGSLIYFRNDLYYDNSGKTSSPESRLKYVKISGGGESPESGGGTCQNCQVFQNFLHSFINSAYATDYGQAALDFYGGKLRLESCQFSDNAGVDVNVDLRVRSRNQNDSLKIIRSNFENNVDDMAVISNIYGPGLASNSNLLNMLVLENNWYDSPDGPKFNLSSSIGGEGVINGALTNGYHNTKWDLFSENSSVMFLPGIKASKLYKKGVLGSEDQLWPPNYFGNDVSELALDEDGGSINDVYTRDIIEEVGAPVIGNNIYKTFRANLNSLKENLTIDDYNLFAYDWRQSVEDVAGYGTPYEEETKSAVGELEKLAEDSQNKKVTIVAHSNGGLLAKAIVKRLEEMGKTEMVDKIILVGTPQMGTPKGVLSLLYGYDEEMIGGSLMNRAEARKLAENMPGAYGLLPSREYFNRLEEPLIDFSAVNPAHNTRYKKFKEDYGESIGKGEFDEFQDFLTGEKDGRVKPAENEIESENILKKNLLEQADQTHQNLDSWNLPENIKLIQIAGWGLDTISGLSYAEKEKVKCYAAPGAKIPSCTGIGEYEPIYEPKWTVDGDEIVTTPSALMMSGNSNTEKYWMDLYRYNDVNPDVDHSNILESDSINRFISDIIKNENQASLPEYIKTSRPEDYANAKPRIRMSLHSPLDIHLYDEKNNHTGPKIITDENGNERTIFEENIPNSYYQQFGERKYVGFPEGQNIRIEMEGYGSGAYTLKLEEIALVGGNEKALSQTTFANLPVSEKTNVSFYIPEDGLSNVSEIRADFDGDEKIDYTVSPIVNGEATLPEAYAMTPSIFRDSVEKYYQDGLIKGKSGKNVLLSGMKLIEEADKLLKMIEANPFINWRAKKVLIAAIERQLENQFDVMIKLVQKDKKNYAPAIKDILIEDLKFIKDNL